MFRFIRTGGPYGDQTSSYKIDLDKSYTVREFVQTVLTENPNEWGYIGIDKPKTIFGDPICEYRYGKLITKPLPDDILDKQIISVEASGGWTNMDYCIKID